MTSINIDNFPIEIDDDFLDKFLNSRILPVQPVYTELLVQIAVLFAAQKLARFRENRVNGRRIRASLCPFKNLSTPV